MSGGQEGRLVPYPKLSIKGGLIYITPQGGGEELLTATATFDAFFDPRTPADRALRKSLMLLEGGLSFRAEPSFPKLKVAFWQNIGLRVALELHNCPQAAGFVQTADHAVLDGVWRPIDVDSFRNCLDLLADNDIDFVSTVTSKNLAWLIWESGLDVELDVSLKDLQLGLQHSITEPFDSNLMAISMFPYQTEGSLFAAEMVSLGRGVLLADEMGLGKTPQAIYVVAKTRAKSSTPVLIVVPSSNLANWLRELERFVPGLDISIHFGNNRAGFTGELDLSGVVVTTYEMVTRDVSFLQEVDWGLIVLDEAQNIKNSQSQRSMAIRALPKNSSLALTGTPIENSLTDAWAIFQFLEPTLLGDAYSFGQQYPDTLESAKSLSKAMSPFVIRRLVEDVGQDLPERSDIEIPIFMTSSLHSKYEGIRSDESLADLPRMMRLRQACTVDFESVKDSPKLDRLMDLLEECFLGANKAIVFTSFTETIDAISSTVRRRFPFAFVDSLDGRKSGIERQAVIDAFGVTQQPGVLVANTRAAGVGLNIQAANYVFHFNPEWNPAQVDQASARVHRRGQDKNVFVYYLFYKGSVEEYMMQRLKEKKQLSEGGLENVSGVPSKGEMMRALQVSPDARLVS